MQHCVCCTSSPVIKSHAPVTHNAFPLKEKSLLVSLLTALTHIKKKHLLLWMLVFFLLNKKSEAPEAVFID